MSDFKFVDWRLTFAWIGVALCALIIGFSLGWIWRDLPQAFARVNPIGVAGPVATFGVSLVALWLGLRQSSQNESRMKVKARSVATVMTVRLDNACLALRHLRVELQRLENYVANLRSDADEARRNKGQSELKGGGSTPTESLPDSESQSDSGLLLRIQEAERGITEKVEGFRGRVRQVLHDCAGLADYEELEALAFAPGDLSHQLALAVTQAPYILPSIDSYWLVFEATCLGRVRGKPSHVLESSLKKIDNLAEQYSKVSAACASYSER